MSNTTHATPTGTDLPHLVGTGFITDGGLETTLIFHEGVDLPDFAAFPLLRDDEDGAALRRYYEAYQDVAERDGVGIVLDTANLASQLGLGRGLGWSRDDLAAVNREAVDFVRGSPIADRRRSNGVIGPRGDGYVVSDTMTAAAAKNYHLLQARAFAEAGADLITAVTMTYVDEALGIVEAARTVGLPVAVGFTVETDGRLPSGQSLRDAIESVDEVTGAAPVYFMVNCAHPTHFTDRFDDRGPWLGRIKAIRANASRMSHAELDEADELDRGNPGELAEDYIALATKLPDLRLVGGCCGTDHEHIATISAVLEGDAMNVVIRHQDQIDVESVAALLREPSVVDGTMRLPHASLASVGRRLEDRPGVIRLVAVDDGSPAGHPESVVGFAEVVTYPDVPRHRHVADLDLLAVRESSQHRGVGRRLLESVIDLADNWLQITRLGLLVWTDNVRAISLYESVGFRIEGTLAQYAWRKGGFVDAHAMGRLTDRMS